MMRRYKTPSEVVRRNGILLVLSMALTFVILRMTLHAAPETDFNVGAYLLPISFWGGVVVVGLACLWGALLVLVRLRRGGGSDDSLPS